MPKIWARDLVVYGKYIPGTKITLSIILQLMRELQLGALFNRLHHLKNIWSKGEGDLWTYGQAKVTDELLYDTLESFYLPHQEVGGCDV